jgi:methylmalonyl-CoA mutase cobalamin-binding subunit
MRPIRVLIGILGLDQHEVGAMAVARMLRDAGMEVVYLAPLLAALREHDLDAPVVVGGSVVTAADARAMRAKGVAAAFGPTADGAEIVATIERLARGRVE